MSTLPKIGVPSALLIALALYFQPAYGGSTGTLQDGSPPTVPAEQPAAAGVFVLAPEAVPSSSSGGQALLRLNRLMADDLRGAAPVLVIPAQEMTAETYDRIVDDLSIMNRILEKTVTDAPELYAYDALRREVGALQMLQLHGYASSRQGADRWPRILRSSSGRPRPMYLGGYGVVFSLLVDFPLLPPPEAPEPNQVAQKTDPTWAQAQRELLDPQPALPLQRGTSPGRAYRAEAVEILRSTLIGLLKHATNIRDLESGAWLTILVQGPVPTTRDGAPESGSAAAAAYVGGSFSQQRQTLILPKTRSEGRTLLTLRAQKADIDQYAKGQLDDAQFQQRVQIVIH